MNNKLKYFFLNIMINFNIKAQNNFLNFQEINVFEFRKINFQEISEKNLDQNYLFLKESLQDFDEKMIFLQDLIKSLTNLNLNIEFITLIRINIFLLQKEILKTLILLIEINEKNQFQKVNLEYDYFNVIFMSFEFKFMNLYMSINKFKKKITEITNINILLKQIKNLNINQKDNEKEINKIKEDLFNFNIKYCSLKEQINLLKISNKNYLNIRKNIISLQKEILTKQIKLLEIEKENQFQKEKDINFIKIYENTDLLKNKLEQKQENKIKKKEEKIENKIKKKIKNI